MMMVTTLIKLQRHAFPSLSVTPLLINFLITRLTPANNANLQAVFNADKLSNSSLTTHLWMSCKLVLGKDPLFQALRMAL